MTTVTIAESIWWPHDLRRGSTTSHLLGSRIRIPLRAWMFVSCICFVLCR